MAKYEKALVGDFHELLNSLHNDITNGSISVSYEDGSDITMGQIKLATRVYDRVYASTGGQSTLSSSVNFSKVASACGYRTAVSIIEDNEFVKELNRCLEEIGPHLIHVQVSYNGDLKIGRPTLLPVENKKRIRAFINRQEIGQDGTHGL